MQLIREHHETCLEQLSSAVVFRAVQNCGLGHCDI